MPVGSSLEFPSENAVIGLYAVVGSRSGIAGGENGSRELYRDLFGRWSSYDRMSICIIADTPDDLRRTEQPVSLCITDQIPDYGTACRLFVIQAETQQGRWTEESVTHCIRPTSARQPGQIG